jgi:hypothetical protein
MFDIYKIWRKNLFSLSTLDSLDKKYSNEDGAIRINRGLLAVVKGNYVNDFYFFQGSTVSLWQVQLLRLL